MAEKQINYLARNFADVRTELFTFIKKYYPEIFSDFSDASIGTMLIELNAAVADMLSYHTDRMFNETQIEFAQERKSILSIARTLGVKIPGLRPSITLVDFSVLVPPFGDGYDTRYTPVLLYGAQVTGAGKVFENLEDIDFNSPFTVGGTPNRTIIPNFNGNGDLINYTITKRELVVNGRTVYFQKTINPSDVKPFLEVVLPENNILSIESLITLDNQVPGGVPTENQFRDQSIRWYEVDSLAEDKIFIDDNSRTSDNKSITPAKWQTINRKFVKEYTDTGFCKLTFGSGTGNDTSQLQSLVSNYANFINTTALGVIPKQNSIINIKYRTGGGSSSNVGPGVLNNTGNYTLSVNGPNESVSQRVRKSLRVTNPIPAVGGAESPSIEELRNLVKYNFASQNRSVTIKDYVAQFLKMPGKFGLAFRWSVEESQNKVLINTIGLNSDGQLSNISSSTLKENISTWLADYRMMNDYVEVKDGRILNLGVNVDLFVDKSFNQSEVVNNTIRAIIDYFDVKKLSMGQDIYISNLVETLNNVAGVLNVVNFSINNLIGGKYSVNLTSQEKIASDLDSVPAIYALNLSDYTIFGQPNSMFEIKYPNQDITVRVKTN
jgi:hypothetical protein|tara:strand:- start:4895 stop:6718 length:1824 start_codon:yes stop_codon:yes gene_type:complete